MATLMPMYDIVDDDYLGADPVGGVVLERLLPPVTTFDTTPPVSPTGAPASPKVARGTIRLSNPVVPTGEEGDDDDDGSVITTAVTSALEPINYWPWLIGGFVLYAIARENRWI